jgi:hypothetical protein
MSRTNVHQRPYVVDVSADCRISPLRLEGFPGLDTSPREVTLRDRVIIWAKSVREARKGAAEGIRATYTDITIHFNNTHIYEGTPYFHQSQYFPSLNATD